MEPEPFLASDPADLRQRIESAQHGGCRSGVHHHGATAGGTVLGDGRAKQGDIHAPAGIDGDLTDVLAPESRRNPPLS